MKIITIPHPTLRQTAQKVEQVDKKVFQFASELGQTLLTKRNPRGVGLAAPQVDKKWQMFATQLPVDPHQPEKTQIRLFVNPQITDHPNSFTFGPNIDEPILEGCLSIPGIYGPVPRFPWVELSFEEIVGSDLVPRREYFELFPARVIQHEFDHLFGKLFIDYTEQYDLPLYKENEQTQKLAELNDELIGAVLAQSKV
jgi:peptide deformylase